MDIDKWSWIDRRTARIRAFFGVTPSEAFVAAAEDWTWAYPEAA